MDAKVGEGSVRCNVLFGHIAVETRMRQDGDRLIGEGRSLYYDATGALTKDTGWQPSGVVLIGDPAELARCNALFPEPK